MLLALVAVSTGLRAWAALGLPTPWIAPDEMVYALVGESLYRSGTLDILGGPTPYYSAVVPAFAGLPLSLGNIELGYTLLKVLQALAMSLTAVPVYLWGRTLVDRRWALAAAALTVALPGLVYSGLVMTEVLFYPVLVLAAWAAARAIERPTLGRQVVLAGVVVLAVLTRLQALVLVPCVLTALGVDAALGRSWATVRRFVPTLAVVGALVVAWAAWLLLGGTVGLGGYEVVANSSYEAGRAARFVLYHAGSLAILSGLFPLAALVLLVVNAARRPEPDRALRAYLAVAASLVAWIVVEVGVFASRYVGQLAERDLIGLAPILFLALVVWLGRGQAGGRLTRAVVALLVAVPVILLPLGRLVTAYAPPDAPTLAPLVDLRNSTSLATLEIVLYSLVGVAVVAFVLLTRRAAVLVPVVLLAGLTGVSVAAARYAADQSTLRKEMFLGDEPRWIDRAAPAPVAFLFQSGTDWTRIWQTLFWNRKVDRVYALGNGNVTGPVPLQRVHFRGDGLLVAGKRRVSPGYLVAPLGSLPSIRFFSFDGGIIATARPPRSNVGDLALWRLTSPRLLYQVAGLQANGDISPGTSGHLVAYGCPRGVFEATLIVKGEQRVTLKRNGKLYGQRTFVDPPGNLPWHLEIPTMPPKGGARGRSACSIDIQTTGLLGTTILQLTPR